MKVLVTGGSGFIGSHLCDKLLTDGHEVVIIDNFIEYYSRNTKLQNISNYVKNKNFTLIEGDIRDEKLVKSALDGVDSVFHLACMPGVRYSIEHPEIYYKINIEGTVKLLQSCMNVNLESFVFTSSSSVYGNPVYLPIDEQHPTNPIAPYGASKLAAEKFCLIFNKQYGMPISIIRIFTTYGPRQRPDEAICKFTKLFLAGGQPEIYGTGNQTRDYTFVSDVVDGIIACSNVKKAIGEVFNIGSGRRMSLNEIVNLIIRNFGINAKIKKVSAKKGDVNDTWADIKRAREVLNYEPKIKIEDGIKIFIDWFKQNPNYYD